MCIVSSFSLQIQTSIEAGVFLCAHIYLLPFQISQSEKPVQDESAEVTFLALLNMQLIIDLNTKEKKTVILIIEMK